MDEYARMAIDFMKGSHKRNQTKRRKTMVSYEERDLGGGITAQFNGKDIELRTVHAGDPLALVALDPDALDALMQYREDIIKHLEQVAERTHTDAFQRPELD